MDLEFQRKTLVFFVDGQPAPGGSKRFVGMSKRTGRAILVDMGGKRNKTWRSAVAEAGRALGATPLEGPLELTCSFVMPRPKKHFYTDRKRQGQLRADAPHWHTNAPDATKLLRSTEDALKGITWGDDSQVARQHASKVYGERPGALIEISIL